MACCIFCFFFACSDFKQDNPLDTSGTMKYPVDIDGNVYPTVILGDQMWTTKNLQVTRYNDGTGIPLVTDSIRWRNLSTPAYSFYNNTTDIAQQNKYGALYNWYTVNTGKLAPNGWRIPTDDDWTKLEKYLIANGYNWDRADTGNKIAKSLASITEWNLSTTTGTIGCVLTNNNKSGFFALPGGGRFSLDHDFDAFGNEGGWWSATESVALKPCFRYLDYGLAYFGKNCGFYEKRVGLSVRLVRDLN
jgi:uncharacterized protein (TIGR02145 family)